MRDLTKALFLVAISAGLASISNADPAADATPEQIATTPVPRDKETWWVQRHESRVAATKRGRLEVAFLGDSITQGWEGAGKAAWDKHFAPLNAVNFGISGDRTEHVLWRLDNGELVGRNPKLVVMMIGTNNLGHGAARQTPDSTATGVKAIVTKLRGKIPAAKILLLAIFPRGEKPDDPLRVKVDQTNEKLKALVDGKMVHFLDIGSKFLGADGVMSRDIMPDFLHPGPAGYEIWAEAIAPNVAELMKGTGAP
jgi:lysophospholipase L1-like esterase